jgi:hypothetical protein
MKLLARIFDKDLEDFAEKHKAGSPRNYNLIRDVRSRLKDRGFLLENSEIKVESKAPQAEVERKSFKARTKFKDAPKSYGSAAAALQSPVAMEIEVQVQVEVGAGAGSGSGEAAPESKSVAKESLAAGLGAKRKREQLESSSGTSSKPNSGEEVESPHKRQRQEENSFFKKDIRSPRAPLDKDPGMQTKQLPFSPDAIPKKKIQKLKSPSGSGSGKAAAGSPQKWSSFLGAASVQPKKPVFAFPSKLELYLQAAKEDKTHEQRRLFSQAQALGLKTLGPRIRLFPRKESSAEPVQSIPELAQSVPVAQQLMMPAEVMPGSQPMVYVPVPVSYLIPGSQIVFGVGSPSFFGASVQAAGASQLAATPVMPQQTPGFNRS